MPTIVAIWLGGVVVFVLGLIGYIMNIAKFMALLNDPITAMALVRAVGIFPLVPVGAIMGWF